MNKQRRISRKFYITSNLCSYSTYYKPHENKLIRSQFRYLLIIILIFTMFSCEVDKNNTHKIDKKFEYKLESYKKSDDVNSIIKDSIYSKLNIKESFLSYQFGDSRASVVTKTNGYLKVGKLAKDAPYLGAKYKSLLYKLKLREHSITFAVDFNYTNKNELYKIELRTITPPLSTNPFSARDFNEIVSIYKEKYKTQWHYNKYVPVTSTMENIDFENIEGNRYICLNLFTDNITITYKNLTLEEKMKEDNLNTSKEDL